MNSKGVLLDISVSIVSEIGPINHNGRQTLRSIKKYYFRKYPLHQLIHFLPYIAIAPCTTDECRVEVNGKPHYLIVLDTVTTSVRVFRGREER